MARILMVEYGDPGSAKDMADDLRQSDTSYEIDFADPWAAKVLAEREKWDVIVIDAGPCEDKNINQTKSLRSPGNSSRKTRVVFISEDFDSDSNTLPASAKDCLRETWIPSTRKDVAKAVRIALHKNYKRNKLR